MNISRRKKLERIYIDFCYHGDLDTHVYSFVEFENNFYDSFRFRMIVLLVILFDSWKEKMFDYIR